MAVPLHSFKSTAAFKTVYAANPQSSRTAVVVVEGDEDRQLLRRWFESDIEAQRLKFTTPRDEGAKAEGCKAVVGVVEACRGGLVPVFGIVDRDAVVSCGMEIFFETDNEVFQGKRPFGDRVRVLCRWEIENYLIDPKALLILAKNEMGDRYVSLESKDVLECLTEVAEAVLVLTAANLVIRKKMLGENLKPGWQLRQTLSGAGMIQQLRSSFLRWQQVEPELGAMQDSLRTFAANQKKGTAEYVYSLLRGLDGKAVLLRVLCRLGLSGSDEKYKRHLATLIANRESSDLGVPGEIRNYIEEFLLQSNGA